VEITVQRRFIIGVLLSSNGRFQRLITAASDQYHLRLSTKQFSPLGRSVVGYQPLFLNNLYAHSLSRDFAKNVDQNLFHKAKQSAEFWPPTAAGTLPVIRR
jgi:hypothetical protein